MRKNQVSIYVQRFTSEAPEGAVRQDIHVYADAYNIWEAVAAANYELSSRILQDQSLPQFGRTNSGSISKVYQKAGDSYIHVADYTDEIGRYAHRKGKRSTEMPNMLRQNGQMLRTVIGIGAMIAREYIVTVCVYIVSMMS